MAAFVLIHGAWHGGWCWDKVAALLRDAGHTVVTPDLPGHGSDATPLADIGLDTYVNRAIEVLEAQQEPVILAGHSMGGLVITQASELRPEKVKALVYVTAFIPRDGESLSQLSSADQESLLNQNRELDRERGVMWVRPEAHRQVFYHDCTDEDVVRAAQLLVPAVAVKPNVTPVHTTVDAFGRIPKYYVECLQDRAIRPHVQRLMYQHTPCQRVFTLDSSHSPFFSMPSELARCLLAIRA
ncbi:MAG TPA: alpha/beta fold hydrolase [Chloroflexota bacterium]|nr:alpha/beta fold hydrolase [Chloroflexota bacterium]